MRRNRRLFMNRIKNFILFVMVLVVIIGIYINFRNSRAEDVILLTAKINDIDEVIKEQVIQLSATKSDDGSYNIKMPEVINTNNVSVYYIETNKNLKVNEDGTINIDLTKEELEEQSIEVKTKYDTKEILLDEEGKVIIQKIEDTQGNTQNEQETQNTNNTENEQEAQEKVILYKKTLTNEEETIIVEGYMPLNAKLNTVQRNLEEEEEKNILTLGNIDQTQKLEILIEEYTDETEHVLNNLDEVTITEVVVAGTTSLSQKQNTEPIKPYNPKDYGEKLTVRAIIEDNALLNKNEKETELVKEIEIEENTSEIVLTIAKNNVGADASVRPEDISEENTISRPDIASEEPNVYYIGNIRYETYEKTTETPEKREDDKETETNETPKEQITEETKAIGRDGDLVIDNNITLKATTSENDGRSFLGGSIQRVYIKSLTFCSSSTINSTILNYSYWDVGLVPGNIYAYYTGDNTNGYDVYLYNSWNSGGVIYANPDASYLFSFLGYDVERSYILWYG